MLPGDHGAGAGSTGTRGPERRLTSRGTDPDGKLLAGNAAAQGVARAELAMPPVGSFSSRSIQRSAEQPKPGQGLGVQQHSYGSIGCTRGATPRVKAMILTNSKEDGGM